MPAAPSKRARVRIDFDDAVTGLLNVSLDIVPGGSDD
jgi:hypothetical protein